MNEMKFEKNVYTISIEGKPNFEVASQEPRLFPLLEASKGEFKLQTNSHKSSSSKSGYSQVGQNAWPRSGCYKSCMFSMRTSDFISRILA